MHSRRKTSPGAFTLLELVLVLAIIAIAMAVIAPSVAAYAKGRDTVNTAGMFVATARWCRAQSIASGNLYRLNLDTSANKWFVTADKGGGNFAQVDGQFGTFTLPDGVTMNSDAPRADNSQTQAIEFDPTGRSDPATVHFVGQKNSLADVACDTPSDLYHVLPLNGGR
jgi:prepilin-type N-terminal cleavage/methylation domain-containing protein